ncbi:MAG: hypothetical protein IJY71_06005 [Clostridia bacterium]|nr:hypothetical protein [Clostridia bacterium]
MKEIPYQFRERLSRVHQPNRYDTSLHRQGNEFVIDGSYTIVLPSDADTVLLHAARDLEDYFFVSMNTSLRLAHPDEAVKTNRIVYGIDTSLPAHSYRFSAKEGEICLIGSDSRMAAQAGYYLEDILNLREAPFLLACEEVRTSLYQPRMAHSGYGLDMYPDEHIVALAHQGVSALLLFVKGVDKTPQGYHDFNDICRRAASYGVDVYAYSYLTNEMHPEDSGAEEYYEALYGGFFDRCPYFRGLILVGESCEFPSHDSNTTMRLRRDNIDENGKTIVKGKPSPGWWPCEDYPALLSMIARVSRRRCPNLDIVFWSYNWHSAPLEARKKLIESIPKDITLQATFEMGDSEVRDGISHPIADYTLFSVGPGKYFSSEVALAAENGLRFYSMTNTGGRTWDIGCVPYLPAPYRWIERYNRMRKAKETYGLDGTMEGHHYGFSPSFITELAKWAFYAPTPNLEKVLAAIVRRDFGGESCEKVLTAYRLFGDAIAETPAKNHDQYGPCRMGPAYPFVLFDNADLQIPTVPYAHFGGNTITKPVYGKWGWCTVPDIYTDESKMKVFLAELAGFRLAEERFSEGCRLLEEALQTVPSSKKENAEQILRVAAFIRNTYRTTVGIKEFYLLKEKLSFQTKDARRETLYAMLPILRREYENAEKTIPLVEADSQLGYEPSMEYMCDKEHLLWKLALLRDVIEREIPALLTEE